MATAIKPIMVNSPSGGMPVSARQDGPSFWYVSAMEKLLAIISDLSHAKSYEDITKIVSAGARELTRADGATVVLRDGDFCHYVDENAISPLWKGKRFPLEDCISGWTMMHAKPALIEDIYKDSRIPISAYKPTFVKSLAMVPIRKSFPVGAIGNYWADHHVPSEEEVSILQALADTTAVAFENVQLYNELKGKIRALQESNYELSRFAWVASHDLREPLRTLGTHVELLDRRCAEQLDDHSRAHMRTIVQSTERLQRLVSDLLVYAQAEKIEGFKPVNMAKVLLEACTDLQTAMEESKADITCGALPEVDGHHALLVRVVQNLLANAVKFRAPGVTPKVHVSCERKDGEWEFCVADNGIGIEPEYLQNIFGLFQRLNTQDVYPGSGIGLATCKKIIELHGGRIWAESRPGEGSRFYFTLPVSYGSIRQEVMQ